MSLRILTSCELEDLFEHFRARPDIWIDHGETWVRRVGEREKCGACNGTGLGDIISGLDLPCENCKGAKYLRNPLGSAYVVALMAKATSDGMHGLTFKHLAWDEKRASDYVLWLLEKYTTYAQRQKVVTILDQHIRPHRTHFELAVVSQQVVEALELPRKAQGAYMS